MTWTTSHAAFWSCNELKLFLARHWAFSRLSQMLSWNSQKQFVPDLNQRQKTSTMMNSFQNRFICQVWVHQEKNRLICKTFTWIRWLQCWINYASHIRNWIQQLKCWKNANIRPRAQTTGYPNGSIIRINLVLVSFHKKLHGLAATVMVGVGDSFSSNINVAKLT